MDQLDANAEQPGGIQLLLARIFTVAEQWGHVDVLCDEDGVRLCLTPAPGLRTFVTVTRQLSVFADLYKVECSTLVGNIEYADDDLIDSLDPAMATSSGGAWETYSNGDVGVTGHLLVADPSSPRLPELIDRLLALQVDDAMAVAAPVRMHGFHDQPTQPTQPTRPTLQLTAHPGPDRAESVDDDRATLVRHVPRHHPSALRRVP